MNAKYSSMMPRRLLLENDELIDAIMSLSTEIVNGVDRYKRETRARLAEMDKAKKKTDRTETNKMAKSLRLEQVVFTNSEEDLRGVQPGH